MKLALILILAAFAVLSAPAQDNSGGAVYFETSFPAFATEREATDALGADPAGREASLKAGDYYWILGTAEGTKSALKRASCAKAVDVLERYWKKNRRDDQVTLCLGYAYMGLCGATPMSELESLLASLNKAQNLFAMVVARLPRNIDARLGRTLINMNLTPQNGRPDALILEDAGVFFAGLAQMPEVVRGNDFYRMGAMEMKLAQALVYHDQGKKAQAKALVGEIDESLLAAPFKALLAPLKRAYGS
jgi:hypothetical protein